jgi:hypothetical protein
MMPFKEDGHYNILKLLYNKKHKKVNPWWRMFLAFSRKLSRN